MKDEVAFSGLEAAIVLIAFVVVAGVFSFVMLGTGFLVTQKAEEITYSGMKQTTSNLLLDGYIYAESSRFSSVAFYVKVPDSGEPLNVADMYIIYGANNEVPKKADFTPTSGLLPPGENTKIILQANSPNPGGKFTIEIKPPIGAPTLIVRTLPIGYEGGVIRY